MAKYKNRKTIIDEIMFDSKKEAEYYCELKLRKRAGDIKDFELQPKFVLQKGFRKNGKAIRPITYMADFKVYHTDGTVEIIDVKGFITKEFRIKQKLFDHQYPELKLSIV